jgi:hypothetical protein
MQKKSNYTAYKNRTLLFNGLALSFLFGLFSNSPVRTEPLADQVNTWTDIPIALDSKIIGSSSSKMLTIRGHVISDVIENGKLCVPSGTSISGTLACLNQNQKVERYFLSFNQLKFADGSCFDIHAIPWTEHSKFRVKRQNSSVSYDAGLISGPTVRNDTPLPVPVVEIGIRPRLEQFILEPGDTFNIRLTQTIFLKK